MVQEWQQLILDLEEWQQQEADKTDPLWYRVVVAFAIVEEKLSNNSNNITPNKNASKKCAFAIALPKPEREENIDDGEKLFSCQGAFQGPPRA